MPPAQSSIVAVACALALAGAGTAHGSCEDRTITLPAGSGTIACTGTTTGSTNQFDPGPNGCVEAFGSSVATPGRDLLYAVTMPGGTILDVVLIPQGPWDPAIYATTSSNPADLPDSCFAGIDVAFDGGTEVLDDIRNETLLDRTIYLIVDSASTSGTFGSGPFTIELRYTLGPTTGDACTGTGPIAVAWSGDTFTFSSSTCGATDDFRLETGQCAAVLGDSLRGRDLVFEVTVPDSVEWRAEVEPAGWDAALYATATCSSDALECLDAVDDGRGGATETTRYVPVRVGDGLPHTQYLVLDSAVPPGQTQGCGAFEITFSRRALAAGTGETCLDPIAVSLPGSGLVALDGWSCGRENDVAPDGTECGTVFSPPLNGPDVMYAVTPQADMTWSLQVIPHGDFDVGVFVATDCFGYFQDGNCFAGADVWGPGKGEVLEHLAGVEGVTYYVFVDTPTAHDCGAYDLFLRGVPTTPVETTSWGKIKALYRAPDAP